MLESPGTTQSGHFRIPLRSGTQDREIDLQRSIYLGQLDGSPSYCGDIRADSPLPERTCLKGLRELFSDLEEDLLAVVNYASQIVTWDKTHQHCGRCGTPTNNHARDRAKICPNCGLISFPRLSPAIIVSIRKADQLLLVHGNRHKSGTYSNVAGFVEPGENLEECVAREVLEEVGVKIKNLEYFGSQSWPFPNSLMVGFVAEYDSGVIVPEAAEIRDAGWFDMRELPPLPDGYTISRKLIDHVVKGLK